MRSPQPTGSAAGRPGATPGPTRLAAQATGVRLGAPVDDRLTATVVAVAPGPGRWEVHTDLPRLVAHLPVHETPPAVGAHVGVTLDPDSTTYVHP